MALFETEGRIGSCTAGDNVSIRSLALPFVFALLCLPNVVSAADEEATLRQCAPVLAAMAISFRSWDTADPIVVRQEWIHRDLRPIPPVIKFRLLTEFQYSLQSIEKAESGLRGALRIASHQLGTVPQWGMSVARYVSGLVDAISSSSHVPRYDLVDTAVAILMELIAFDRRPGRDSEPNLIEVYLDEIKSLHSESELASFWNMVESESWNIGLEPTDFETGQPPADLPRSRVSPTDEIPVFFPWRGNPVVARNSAMSSSAESPASPANRSRPGPKFDRPVPLVLAAALLIGIGWVGNQFTQGLWRADLIPPTQSAASLPKDSLPQENSASPDEIPKTDSPVVRPKQKSPPANRRPTELPKPRGANEPASPRSPVSAKPVLPVSRAEKEMAEFVARARTHTRNLDYEKAVGVLRHGLHKDWPRDKAYVSYLENLREAYRDLIVAYEISGKTREGDFARYLLGQVEILIPAIRLSLLRKEASLDSDVLDGRILEITERIRRTEKNLEKRIENEGE